MMWQIARPWHGADPYVGHGGSGMVQVAKLRGDERQQVAVVAQGHTILRVTPSNRALHFAPTVGSPPGAAHSGRRSQPNFWRLMPGPSSHIVPTICVKLTYQRFTSPD